GGRGWAPSAAEERAKQLGVGAAFAIAWHFRRPPASMTAASRQRRARSVDANVIDSARQAFTSKGGAITLGAVVHGGECHPEPSEQGVPRAGRAGGAADSLEGGRHFLRHPE